MRKQIVETAAMAMIGEGLVGLIAPTRHLLLRRTGPQGFRSAIDAMAWNPTVMRLVFAAELGLGGWLTLRQTRE